MKWFQLDHSAMAGMLELMANHKLFYYVYRCGCSDTCSQGTLCAAKNMSETKNPELITGNKLLS